MENLKQALEKFKHRYAPIFFSTILCFVALVYKSYNYIFFQNTRFTEIIRFYILIRALSFLTRLPTRQDGVENHDKVN